MAGKATPGAPGAAPKFRPRSGEPVWKSLALDLQRQAAKDTFDGDAYRFKPVEYIRRWLRWEPWGGTPEHPGQVEIYEYYALVLKQLQERRDYGLGKITEGQLTVYKPGMVIKNWIRVEAATGVGKTRLSSGFANHYFDCFAPSIIYVLAPSFDQIERLTFKEIKATRTDKGLPGRIMELEVNKTPEHFILGRATQNSQGTGLERIKGQHSPHMGLVIEEADGVEDFVYEGAEEMAKGFAVVVMIANPRSLESKFHNLAYDANVQTFRMDAIHFPNVLENKDIIPGGVTRDDVERSLEKHCTITDAHNVDLDTFEVPWRPGVIYIPNDRFRTNYLGCPPTGTERRIFITQGRYEEACRRDPLDDDDPWVARVGIDVARDGPDKGVIWVRHAGRAYRWAKVSKDDYHAYAGKAKELCEKLRGEGVTDIWFRIDNGGGFGGGVADLIDTPDFRAMFEPPQDTSKEDAAKWAFKVSLINFGGNAMAKKKFADKVTELYATAAEVITGIRIDDPPSELKGDLTQREYKWTVKKGREVKILEPKEAFRTRQKRSPDDGDGFCLAVAPDSSFTAGWYWSGQDDD